MPPPDLAGIMHGVRESTARLLLGLGALGEDDPRRPSLLPGWTVGHVLTHLARNADAMCNGLGGALRGVPTPAYPGGDEGRAADIEAGSGRSLDDLAEDVRSSAQRLDEVWLAMPEPAWDNDVLNRSGPIPAWQTVDGRWREVEIHWVDLDLGYGPDGWPPAFTARLLDTLTGPALAGRLPGGTRLGLSASDTGAQWSAGPAGSPEVAVHGPSWALACWLAGRPAPALDALKSDAADLPELTPWS